jgi:transposase
MLSKGEHRTVIARQCGVSHQTIYNWRHAWETGGVVGLIREHTGGRPRKLSEAWLATVCELARIEALTLRGLVQRAEAIHGEPFPLSLDQLGVILRKNGFSFKRTRMSLKKP